MGIKERIQGILSNRTQTKEGRTALATKTSEEANQKEESLEIAGEFPLYQLVHEEARSVGMADGEMRELSNGIREYDSYAFHITKRGDGNLNVTGEICTLVYEVEKIGSETSSHLIGERKKPIKTPSGASVELFEPAGEGMGYEDPTSPVPTYKTGQTRIVEYSQSKLKVPVL